MYLQSRRGTRLHETFPEVVWAVYEHLPVATVVDSEIVRWSIGQAPAPAIMRRGAVSSA
ncbi:hypothetical protein [Nonomuraea sp. 10N515B]|uniref:hypothetical protein n=1 Tax=Nonomuraea sp. 10N515B TaxID=3457422 RepID=UPI003FCD3150